MLYWYQSNVKDIRNSDIKHWGEMSFPLYRLCCRGLSRCYLDILKTLLWQSLAHSCITLSAPGAHHLNAPDCAAVTAPHWCPSAGSPAITFRPELPSRRPLLAGHIPATGCSSPGPRGNWMKEWERRGRERDKNLAVPWDDSEGKTLGKRTQADVFT